MNFIKDVWLKKYFKRPLTLLVGVLVLGVGMMVFVSGLRADLALKSQHYSDQVERSGERVSFLTNEQHLKHQYQRHYHFLVKSGVLDAQYRVKWTDELLMLKERLQLKPMHIQFGSEKKISEMIVDGHNDQAGIYATQLKLTMGLQSDLDVLTLFRAIRRDVTPVFSVNGCRIQRHMANSGKLSFDPKSAIFIAKCSVMLYRAVPKPFEETKQEGK